jgi:hypothetical protein
MWHFDKWRRASDTRKLSTSQKGNRILAVMTIGPVTSSRWGGRKKKTCWNKLHERFPKRPTEFLVALYDSWVHQCFPGKSKGHLGLSNSFRLQKDLDNFQLTNFVCLQRPLMNNQAESRIISFIFIDGPTARPLHILYNSAGTAIPPVARSKINT